MDDPLPGGFCGTTQRGRTAFSLAGRAGFAWHRSSPASATGDGLAGKRLTVSILCAIVQRAAERAGFDKRVTQHTLRYTAATWLRQETGDARLVAASGPAA